MKYFRPAPEAVTVSASPAPPSRPVKVDRRRLDRAADIRLFIGSTGSGKTFRLRQQLRGWKGRVIAWDWKHEFIEYPAAETIPELIDLVKRRKSARYIPNLITPPHLADKFKTSRAWTDWQFEMVCRICWTVQEADPGTDLAMVVEEASEVLRASYAPPWWRRIITQGRVMGFSPFVLGQRPTMIDADTRSAATDVVCGRLQFPDDAKVMAMIVREPVTAILALPPKHAFVINDKGEKDYSCPAGEGPPRAKTAPENPILNGRQKVQKSRRKA